MKSASMLLILCLSIYSASLSARCLNPAGKIDIFDKNCATAMSSTILDTDSNPGIKQLNNYIKQHQPVFNLGINTDVVISIQGKDAWHKAQQDYGLLEVEKFDANYEPDPAGKTGKNFIGSISLFVRTFKDRKFTSKYWATYKFNDVDFIVSDNVARYRKTSIAHGIKFSGLYVRTDTMIYEFIATAMNGDPQQMIDTIYQANKAAF